MGTVFILEEHLPQRCFVISGAWVIRLDRTANILASHLQWHSFFKVNVFLWNKHLQSYLFSKLQSQFTIPVAAIPPKIHPWFQTCIYWTIVVICQHQLHLSIYFMVLVFYGTSIWSHLLCQRHCVYFTTLIVAIHYSKSFVVDSMTFEGTVFIWAKQL